MRQIKFRAWGVDAEVMHDWNTVQKIDKWWNHEALILMQFTGLLDKNGKEIWEGDIVKMYVFDASPVPLEIKTSVLFHEGVFTVIKVNEEPISLRDAVITSNKTKKGLEIIGNIYENLELLNK
jgi:uncharacterized phage protein (TIGR01671 family)